MRMRPATALALLVSLCPFLSREAACAATEDVYRKHKDAVLRVRILERSSGAQATVGSGFFAGSGAVAVTNFHVVSHLVWAPESYEGVALLESGASAPIELLAVDVIHDLAAFRVKHKPARKLSLAAATPPKGKRLYAMGNPHDLGMTIVEGSYSGLLDESLVQRVHLTGTLNPGMSGGPVLDASGEVVGVSAASAGAEVSFLVPVKFVRPLMARASAAATTEELRAAVSEQLAAHQEEVAAVLTAAPFQAQGLGPFQVPGKLSPAFRCWANSNEGKGQPYDVIHSQCQANDFIFVNDELRTGAVDFVHHMLETDQLNAFRFSALQKQYFHHHSPVAEETRFLMGAGKEGDEEDLTPYDCSSADVAAGDLVMKAVLCLRAYKKFPGLYDLHWRGMSFVDSRRAVTSNLTVEGTSRENAEKFLRRYLEAFAWKK